MEKLPVVVGQILAGIVAAASISCASAPGQAATAPVDPGVRGGAPGAGVALKGLSADETAFFQDGLSRFVEIESVTGGQNNGLGARFNSNSCQSCHAQPGVGGSSPAANPSIALATLNGAKNAVPWFIVQKGPIREAPFKQNPDGTNDPGVPHLFLTTRRSDAAGCNIAQPNFLPAGNPLTGHNGNPNITFPTPPPLSRPALTHPIPNPP